tara:strand:- start:85 stop:342 length:258 start_codon:yes stop_codon:yes gene_type:complete
VVFTLGFWLLLITCLFLEEGKLVLLLLLLFLFLLRVSRIDGTGRGSEGKRATGRLFGMFDGLLDTLLLLELYPIVLPPDSTEVEG